MWQVARETGSIVWFYDRLNTHTFVGHVSCKAPANQTDPPGRGSARNTRWHTFFFQKKIGIEQKSIVNASVGTIASFNMQVSRGETWSRQRLIAPRYSLYNPASTKGSRVQRRLFTCRRPECCILTLRTDGSLITTFVLQPLLGRGAMHNKGRKSGGQGGGRASRHFTARPAEKTVWE